MKKYLIPASVVAFSFLVQQVLAAEYRPCQWNGQWYGHGSKNSAGQTCDDGVWRG